MIRALVLAAVLLLPVPAQAMCLVSVVVCNFASALPTQRHREYRREPVIIHEHWHARDAPRYSSRRSYFGGYYLGHVRL